MMIRSFAAFILFIWFFPLFADNNQNCDKKNICSSIETENDETSVYLQAKNLIPGTHITIYTAIEGSNIETEPQSPISFVLTDSDKKKVLTFKKRENTEAPVSVAVLAVAYYGDLSAKHDETYVYTLPYEGKSWISIGYNSGEEHKGGGAYSLDFVLPEGTSLLAARDGIVVETEDKFTEGRRDPKLIDKANRIVIEHSDGTVAIYGHLKSKGVLVKPGDKVVAGQKIGLSGNTGFSTGPHLHFEVYKPEENRKKKSFATLFKTESEEKEYLSEENAYWTPDGKTPPGFPITNLAEFCISNSIPDPDKPSSCPDKLQAKRKIYLSIPIYKSGPYTFKGEFISLKTKKVSFTFQEKIPSGINFEAWEIQPVLSAGKYKIKFYLEEKEIGERSLQILP
ncbi:M23 family metallopeptidase [Leptospira haakeii]|nr:M23 family metallopeptidase [Leptospira haakeii]